MTDTTEIEAVADHLAQAAAKMGEVTAHLQPVAAFLQRMRINPLVTGFGASIPGEVSADTQAVLNGLLPILGALGAKGLAQPPAAPPDPTLSRQPSITIGGGSVAEDDG